MFKGWQLPAKRASLGVAMVGDRQFCLIPSTLAIPCRAKQVRLVGAPVLAASARCAPQPGQPSSSSMIVVCRLLCCQGGGDSMPTTTKASDRIPDWLTMTLLLAPVAQCHAGRDAMIHQVNAAAVQAAMLTPSGVQIFTTVHHNQTELAVLIYQGESSQASKNRMLSNISIILSSTLLNTYYFILRIIYLNL